jgi:hypothetical protein
MTIPTFRSLMGRKPSLTLELDGHTADAGINTRIDAAFDIINNCMVSLLGGKPDIRHQGARTSVASNNGFQPASIDITDRGAFFITSSGEKFLSTTSGLKYYPSMGDLAARLFAAECEAKALTPSQ